MRGASPGSCAVGAAVLGKAPARRMRSRAADAFLPAESGTGHAPWFGPSWTSSQADPFLTPIQRLQFGGSAGRGRWMGPEGGPKNGPMFRYVLAWATELEVFSSQSLEAGAFTDSIGEAGRARAGESRNGASLPAGLRDRHGGARGGASGMLFGFPIFAGLQGRTGYSGQLVETSRRCWRKAGG